MYSVVLFVLLDRSMPVDKMAKTAHGKPVVGERCSDFDVNPNQDGGPRVGYLFETKARRKQHT